MSRSNVAFLEHENFERYGNYNRLHYEGQSFTDLDELLYAGRIARMLMERGIRPGDRVLTVMPNTPGTDRHVPGSLDDRRGDCSSESAMVCRRS